MDGKWAKEEQEALTARQQKTEAEVDGEEKEAVEEDGESGEAVEEEADDEEERRVYREKMYSMWAARQTSVTETGAGVKSAWE